MTNPSGTAFETHMVDYFVQWFKDACRLVKKGAKDEGDIGGMPDVIEAKRRKGAFSLPAAMREAQKEAENAGRRTYVVVHKHWGKGQPQEQFVTMPAWRYVEFALLEEEDNA